LKKVEKQYKQNRRNAFCSGVMSNCIDGAFFVSEMVDKVPAAASSDVEPFN
jgi:hypothetical protein